MLALLAGVAALHLAPVGAPCPATHAPLWGGHLVLANIPLMGVGSGSSSGGGGVAGRFFFPTGSELLQALIAFD